MAHSQCTWCLKASKTSSPVHATDKPHTGFKNKRNRWSKSSKSLWDNHQQSQQFDADAIAKVVANKLGQNDSADNGAIKSAVAEALGVSVNVAPTADCAPQESYSKLQSLSAKLKTFKQQHIKANNDVVSANESLASAIQRRDELQSKIDDLEKQLSSQFGAHDEMTAQRLDWFEGWGRDISNRLKVINSHTELDELKRVVSLMFLTPGTSHTDDVMPPAGTFEWGSSLPWIKHSRGRSRDHSPRPPAGETEAVRAGSRSPRRRRTGSLPAVASR